MPWIIQGVAIQFKTHHGSLIQDSMVPSPLQQILFYGGKKCDEETEYALWARRRVPFGTLRLWLEDQDPHNQGGNREILQGRFRFQEVEGG